MPETIQIPEDKILILFDGVCNLCNSSVLFVIKRDHKNKFLFAPLQGKTGAYLIKKYDIDTTKVDSIIIYEPQNDKLRYKSSAALTIASKMPFPYPLMRVFFLIPLFIRNWVYDIIAKNRYKWFGKKEACMIPSPELKSKFLE